MHESKYKNLRNENENIRNHFKSNAVRKVQKKVYNYYLTMKKNPDSIQNPDSFMLYAHDKNDLTNYKMLTAEL